MKSESKLRIYGYGRLSSAKQLDGYGLGDQEWRIEQFLKLQYPDGNYDYQYLCEAGESGETLNRTKMKELLALITSKQVDVVIVTKLDRLTRSVSDLLNLLNMFEKYKVKFVSIADNVDTSTAIGKFFITMMGSLAEFEVNNLSERTNRGLIASARNGNYPCSGSPFGYIRSPDDYHKLIVNEEYRPVIIEIFSSIASDEMTANKLSKIYNEVHVLDRNWSSDLIYKIIKNPIYKGIFIYKGEEYDSFPPIVSSELWEKANKNIRHNHGRRQNDYIYKGILRCSISSDHKITCTCTKKSGTKYRYYYCNDCRKYLNEDIITTALSDNLNYILIANLPTLQKENPDYKHRFFKSMSFNEKRDFLKRFVDYIEINFAKEIITIHRKLGKHKKSKD